MMKHTEIGKPRHADAILAALAAAFVALALLQPLNADDVYGQAKASIEVAKPAKVNLDVEGCGKLKVKKKVSGVAKSKVKVKYESSNKKILTVTAAGKYTAKAPGRATVTVKAVKGKQTLAKATVKFTVNGLCLDDSSMDYCNYLYKGRSYGPGELSPELEAQLCFNVKDIQVYLKDYLPKYREEIDDPTEAALTAMINYNVKYMKTRIWTDEKHQAPWDMEWYTFDSHYVGSAEDGGQTLWAFLAEHHVGACVYYSSYFSYLCYLSGVPCLQIEDDGHDWNLIYHDNYDGYGGYYYNLDNHYLLCAPEDDFAAPPFNTGAAKLFKNQILTSQYRFPLVNLATQDVSKMGRNLSDRCPMLMYENTGTKDAPEYRVFFDTLTKDHVPVFADGTKITMDKMVYRNMELDADNDEKAPFFRKASQLLQEEVKGLLK